MSDEAVITTLLGNNGDRVEYTVAAGTAIPIGSLMYISASGTALITDGVRKIIAGIASAEKSATDGVTKMSLITHCVCTLTCGAGESMTFGEPVSSGAVANEVDLATDDTVEGSAFVVGTAMNTVAGNAQGDVLMNLGRTR